MRATGFQLVLLETLALAGLRGPAGAQPVGSEFQVNTYTTGNQRTGSDHLIAADAGGDFVVVWHSFGQDGAGDGVFGQRYDSLGDPLENEFQVNSYITGDQGHPSVASDPMGKFVVVWNGTGQGDPSGIFGQRYDSAGDALGAEFRVNSFTTGPALEPSVASDASGNFVVVWQAHDTPNLSDSQIFGQRYDSGGAPLGSQFLVSVPKARPFERAPSVASDAVGNFVVVWNSLAGPEYYEPSYIYGRRYDSQGAPQGSAFKVTPARSNWAPPSVASDASGNFVVVWSNEFEYRYGFYGDVFAQRYDSEGVKRGGQFRVNSYSTWFQGYPSVASDASGNFMVAWDGDGPDPGGEVWGVYGRRFNNVGVAQGLEFLINSHTAQSQGAPSAVATDANKFIVVWSSQVQDGSGDGVFGQRFDYGGTSMLHAGDLDRRAKNVGASWRAQVKTTVHDDGHASESGVLVTFNVSGGVGTRTCTTTGSGVCEVSVVVGDALPSLTFTVTSLGKAGFGYDAGANHDPDPDSNGTVIVVNQP